MESDFVVCSSSEGKAHTWIVIVHQGDVKSNKINRQKTDYLLKLDVGDILTIKIMQVNVSETLVFCDRSLCIRSLVFSIFQLLAWPPAWQIITLSNTTCQISTSLQKQQNKEYERMTRSGIWLKKKTEWNLIISKIILYAETVLAWSQNESAIPQWSKSCTFNI